MIHAEIILCDSSAVYTGSLTATLAVSQVKWPFHDLRGLGPSDYKSLITDGTFLYVPLR